MRGIYFDGKRAVYREDLPVPEPAPGHSRIRILLAGICSTDREILKGYRPDFRGIMGHEFVGIAEKSEGRPELLGKMVVGELNEGCGHCLYCRSGREKHCPKRKVIGMDGLDGCFAEYMILADHLLHEVPEGLPPEQAAYTEPLAAALEIPSQVHVDPAGKAAVIGDGRLALMTAQVLSLSGVDLTVIGKHPEKLERFRPYAKIKMTKDYAPFLTENRAADFREPEIADTYELVAEASGSPQGIQLAGLLVRRKGTIVLKSTYAGSVQLDMSHYVVNEITIVGSRCGPFEPALNLLSRKKITLPDIEWHALSDFETAFSSRAFKSGFRLM